MFTTRNLLIVVIIALVAYIVYDHYLVDQVPQVTHKAHVKPLGNLVELKSVTICEGYGVGDTVVLERGRAIDNLFDASSEETWRIRCAPEYARDTIFLGQYGGNKFIRYQSKLAVITELLEGVAT